jgi:hypothetical protein
MKNNELINDFASAWEETRTALQEIEDRAAAHVDQKMRELWERPAEEHEKQWGRDFVARLRSKSLTARMPTASEMKRQLGLPRSEVARRRLWGQNA